MQSIEVKLPVPLGTYRSIASPVPPALHLAAHLADELHVPALALGAISLSPADHVELAAHTSTWRRARERRGFRTLGADELPGISGAVPRGVAVVEVAR